MVKDKIHNFKPDIIHIHSLLPFITPSIIKYAASKNIKMVFTLHDFKLLHHDGMVYNPDEKARSFKDLCNPKRWKHGSFALTVLYSYLLTYYRRSELFSLIDQFIAPSRFLYNYFIDVQFKSDEISYIPHFLPDFRSDITQNGDNQTDKYFLFLGRLSPEKGASQLARHWTEQNIPYTLKIVGGGVEENKIRSLADIHSNIQLIGEVDWQNGLNYLANMYALIAPSVCYESFGLNILESFIAQKPVISTYKAGRMELVKEKVNALQYPFDDGKALKKCVELMAGNPQLRDILGVNGRHLYEQNFNPERYLNAILKLYRNLLV